MNSLYYTFGIDTVTVSSYLPGITLLWKRVTGSLVVPAGLGEDKYEG